MKRKREKLTILKEVSVYLFVNTDINIICDVIVLGTSSIFLGSGSAKAKAAERAWTDSKGEKLGIESVSLQWEVWVTVDMKY